MFENPPDNNSTEIRGEQPEINVLFHEDDGLEVIIDKLLELKSMDGVVSGSSHDFSPREIAEQIQRVLQAAEQIIADHDRNLNFNLPNLGVDSTLGEQIRSMPEFNDVTRSSGLRAALVEAVVSMEQSDWASQNSLPRYSFRLSIPLREKIREALS